MGVKLQPIIIRREVEFQSIIGTMVIYFILNGESKTFEIETVGNDAEQLTAFLAEANKDLQEELVYHNFITSDEEFYDIHVSVLCGNCPLCAASISTENI